MKFRIRLITLLSVATFGSIASAHEDTPLIIKDGKLTGLPDRYLPAAFDFKNPSLSIAGKKLVFPKVLQSLFTYIVSDDPFDDTEAQVKVQPFIFKFSSSWYHSAIGSNLPPYLLITITPKAHEDDNFGIADYRFELLIDIDKLRLIRADMQVKDIGRVPIDLDGILDTQKTTNGEQSGAGRPLSR